MVCYVKGISAKILASKGDISVLHHCKTLVQDRQWCKTVVGDIFMGILNMVSLVFMLNPGDYVMIQCDKQGLSILPSISLIVMIMS